MRLIGHQASRKSEDGEVLVIQNLSHCACHQVFSYICLCESHEMIYNDENIFHLRFLPQIPWYLHLDKVNMDQVHGFGGKYGHEFQCVDIGFEDEALSTILESQGKFLCLTWPSKSFLQQAQHSVSSLMFHELVTSIQSSPLFYVGYNKGKYILLCVGRCHPHI